MPYVVFKRKDHAEAAVKAIQSHGKPADWFYSTLLRVYLVRAW